MSRLCDVGINMVMKLLVDVGTACSIYRGEMLRNLPCKRIQCDEIWAFCALPKPSKNLIWGRLHCVD